MSIKRDLNIEEIIAEMKKELLTLHAERSAIDGRMDTIKKALTGLATLYGDEAISFDFLEPKHPNNGSRRGRLTAACRSILLKAKLPLSTKEVHELIALEHPESLMLHKQPYTAVAVTLKRLALRGEAHVVSNRRGKTLWSREHDPSRLDTRSSGESTSVSVHEFTGAPKLERKFSAN
jgi:hypothetical protein